MSTRRPQPAAGPWHKWPEEEPPKMGHYLIWVPSNCHARYGWFTPDASYACWESVDPRDGEVRVTHWAEIRPPKETK